MADDVAVTPGIGASVATDEVGGRHFQRVKVTHGADGTATDVSAASPLPVDSELPPAAALTDAMANPTAPAVGAHGMIWDATAATWLRHPALSEGTLLASAARTTPTSSPVQTNPGFRGVLLIFAVTAVSGSGGLFVRVREGGSGLYLHESTAIPDAVSAVGVYGLLLMPGALRLDTSPTAGYTNFTYSVGIPRRWDALVTHLDGSSYTYSLTYSYLA